MKFYKTSKDRILVTEHNIEGRPYEFLAATPTLPTEYCHFYFKSEYDNEVKYEDIKYLKHHLPKFIKKILSESE